MTHISTAQTLRDKIHRLALQLVGSGHSATLEDAEAFLGHLRLHIELGPEVATSPSLQAALFTTVNVGARAFRGGVTVGGNLDFALQSRLRLLYGSATEAITRLGGRISSNGEGGYLVQIGTPMAANELPPFAIQVTFDGWRAGVVPLDGSTRLPEVHENELAGATAGALAVSEAFQHATGNPKAGRRSIGISLWTPGAPWQEESEDEPLLTMLPSRYWVLGLGHLGQAFLWNLSLLPFGDGSNVELVLQDRDRIAPANESTSVLTFDGATGTKKTRTVAAWCDRLGFETHIVERRFTAGTMREEDEPGLLFCGVDNAETRAILEQGCFDRIIEAGLGANAHNYLEYQIHTFPAFQKATERWATEPHQLAPDLENVPSALRQLAEREQLDACGLQQIAGISVGSAFVGVVVTAMALAQAVRCTEGLPMHAVISGSLRNCNEIEAALSQTSNTGVNLGFTNVEART